MNPRGPVPFIREREQGDGGVVAVEFAVVLPVLVALLFTIVTAGSVFIDQLQLQSVARDAARVASVSPTSACALARTELSGNSVGTLQCTLVSDCLTPLHRCRSQHARPTRSPSSATAPSRCVHRRPSPARPGDAPPRTAVEPRCR